MTVDISFDCDNGLEIETVTTTTKATTWNNKQWTKCKQNRYRNIEK